MIDTTLHAIAAVRPRPLRVEYYQVMATQPDAVPVAIEKVKQDRTAWVKPDDVESVLEALKGEITQGRA